jgi:hypothetical protein
VSTAQRRQVDLQVPITNEPLVAQMQIAAVSALRNQFSLHRTTGRRRTQGRAAGFSNDALGR